MIHSYYTYDKYGNREWYTYFDFLERINGPAIEYRSGAISYFYRNRYFNSAFKWKIAMEEDNKS